MTKLECFLSARAMTLDFSWRLYWGTPFPKAMHPLLNEPLPNPIGWAATSPASSS